MASHAEIAVIGMGYIGLPTAVVLARAHHDVIGVDVDPGRVEAINDGRAPFAEHALDDCVAQAVAVGRFRAQTTTPSADIYIIAVPTPFAEGYRLETRYIDAAVDSIIPQLAGHELVILESTVPPGSTEYVAARILAARPELVGLEFAHAPERVLPGRVLEELVTNDRIIGGVTPAAAERARQLYASFCDAEIHLTDARTAELAKLTENSFRDVSIAFANEISIICDQLGINAWDLIELANRHPRVNILQPGPGVGGHCIAVDPWFVVSSAPEAAQLIRTARVVNDSKPQWVLSKVREACDGVERPVIAALGLAFKADIDDLRESPALAIAAQLPSEIPGSTVLAVEPNVQESPASLDGTGVILSSLEEALERADVLVLLVDHREFIGIDRSVISGKRVVDTRGVWR